MFACRNQVRVVIISNYAAADDLRMLGPCCACADPQLLHSYEIRHSAASAYIAIVRNRIS